MSSTSGPLLDYCSSRLFIQSIFLFRLHYKTRTTEGKAIASTAAACTLQASLRACRLRACNAGACTPEHCGRLRLRLYSYVQMYSFYIYQ